MWAAVFFYASLSVFLAMQVFYFLMEGKVKAWSLRTQFAGLTVLITLRAGALGRGSMRVTALSLSRCREGFIARVAEPKANPEVKSWLILSEALSFSTH